jgi:hypothetical protein
MYLFSMSNAAHLLADLLDSWAIEAGETAEQVRGRSGDATHGLSDLTFWRDVGLAMDYIRSIEKSLDAMEAAGRVIEHYRDVVPDLYDAVVEPKIDWEASNSKPRAALDLRDMRTLRALGDVLETGSISAVLSPTGTGEILKALLETRETIEQSDLAASTKLYLIGLIQHAQNRVENIATFGDDAVVAAANEAAGAVLVVATSPDADPTLRERLASNANSIVVGVSSALMTDGARSVSALLGQIAKAITS